MADDNYDDATADNYAATDDAAAVNDDDFYSMKNVTDDYTDPLDYYSTGSEGDDYYSAKMATYWLDKLLYNSTSTDYASLSPVQDATPESIFAALALNTIACIMLLSLYEVLRRLIPSVYSQRLVNEQRNGESYQTVESALASVSGMKASGQTLRNYNLNAAMAGKKDDKEECSMSSCRADSLFEWVLPIYQTPWSTIRELAGLDCYFYLRYIRMCLKLTFVSSFWAMVILCPVYATGGGGQSGCYYFSMANVLPGDKFRVWVPTIFQWLFSLYTCFCIRSELRHYVELRQQFLGGLDEVRDTKSRNYQTPDAVPSGTSSREERPAHLNSDDLSVTGSATQLKRVENSSDNREIKQHRYSLLIEKVPVALRSNVALYSYFDQLFPGQVHSASIAMNVPDLDQMSARRLRVCRRLEKSVAYLRVTGQRPTHMAGRPRLKALGIESEPFSLCCPEPCGSALFDDGDGIASKIIYETLPEKGQRVDSIAYYTLDLAMGNIRMRELQQEKFRIAETGASPRHLRSILDDDGVDQSHCDWYRAPLKVVKQSAKLVADGLREEFEVSGEEDYLGDGIETSNYGSLSSSPKIPRYTKSKEKNAPLVDESHLQETEIPSTSEKSRSRNRPHTFLRAIAWRMGLDFLSSIFDYVKTRTDVMVDNISRPSMSSTGFVTFTHLTPVTVSTRYGRFE